MPLSGYYRFPAIHSDSVVFVSEDDIWSVAAAGGVARRLTANLGTISNPYFSPDGNTLVFTGRDEGHNEIYTMPANGGPARRLTYLGVNCATLGWTPDGSKILFCTDSGRPRDRDNFVHSIGVDGGLPEPWPVGPALSISVAEGAGPMSSTGLMERRVLSSSRASGIGMVGVAPSFASLGCA